MRHLLCLIVFFIPYLLLAQCNQHVFSSVGAEKWTSFQYQDCDGGAHYFGLPSGGYTILSVPRLVQPLFSMEMGLCIRY